jgi:hypothetical protein
MSDSQVTQPAPDSLHVYDALIIIGGVALAAFLLISDSDQHRFPFQGCHSWGFIHNYMQDWRDWIGDALPLALWYLLAGPTLAGPFIVALHHPSNPDRRFPFGRTLWALFGLLIAIDIILTYVPVWLFGIDKSGNPLKYLGASEAIVWVHVRARALLYLATFLIIPVSTLGAIIITMALPRRHQQSPTPKFKWMDVFGLSLGFLCVLRNLAFFYWCTGHQTFEVP